MIIILAIAIILYLVIKEQYERHYKTYNYDNWYNAKLKQYSAPPPKKDGSKYKVSDYNPVPIDRKSIKK